MIKVLAKKSDDIAYYLSFIIRSDNNEGSSISRFDCSQALLMIAGIHNLLAETLAQARMNIRFSLFQKPQRYHFPVSVQR